MTLRKRLGRSSVEIKKGRQREKIRVIYLYLIKVFLKVKIIYISSLLL